LIDDILIDKIHIALNECDKHIKRLKFATGKIKSLMPLDEKIYKSLSDEEVAYIDQFLYRFAKLQDTLGQRLFKYTLKFLGEDIENKPFIDILNLLEKLTVIDSAKEWMELRGYRNELSHNYENNPQTAVELINTLFLKQKILEEIFLNIKNTLEEKGL